VYFIFIKRYLSVLKTFEWCLFGTGPCETGIYHLQIEISPLMKDHCHLGEQMGTNGSLGLYLRCQFLKHFLKGREDISFLGI